MDSMDPTYEPHPRFTMQARIVNIGGDALSKKKCWKDREISPDGDRDCRIASRGLQGGFKKLVQSLFILITSTLV